MTPEGPRACIPPEALVPHVDPAGAVVIGLVIAGLAASLRRDPDEPAVRGPLLGWALAALVARLTLAWPRAILHGVYHHGRLEFGATPDPDLFYGRAGTTLHALANLVARLTVADPPARLDAVLHLNLLLSALTVPLAWLGLRRLLARAGADADLARRAAHLGALALTLHPVLLATSRSEILFVPAAFFGAAALAGVAGTRTRDGLAGGLAAAALAITRPLQVAPAALLLLLGVRVGHRAALLPGVVLFAWRLAEIGSEVGDGAAGAARLNAFAQVAPPFSRHSPLLVGDMAAVPAVLGVLVLVGLLGPERTWPATLRAPTAALSALWAASALPAHHMMLLSDKLRFQTPAQLWWTLAAAPAAAVLTRRPAGAAGLMVAATLTWWVARTPVGPPPTWEAQQAFLRVAMADLPDGDEVIWYDAGDDPHGRLGRWLARASERTVCPHAAERAPRDGELQLIAISDATPWAETPLPCGRTPLREAPLPTLGREEDVGDEPLTMGIYRLTGCAAAGGPSAIP